MWVLKWGVRQSRTALGSAARGAQDRGLGRAPLHAQRGRPPYSPQPTAHSPPYAPASRSCALRHGVSKRTQAERSSSSRSAPRLAFASALRRSFSCRHAGKHVWGWGEPGLGLQPLPPASPCTQPLHPHSHTPSPHPPPAPCPPASPQTAPHAPCCCPPPAQGEVGEPGSEGWLARAQLGEKAGRCGWEGGRESPAGCEELQRSAQPRHTAALAAKSHLPAGVQLQQVARPAELGAPQIARQLRTPLQQRIEALLGLHAPLARLLSLLALARLRAVPRGARA